MAAAHKSYKTKAISRVTLREAIGNAFGNPLGNCDPKTHPWTVESMTVVGKIKKMAQETRTHPDMEDLLELDLARHQFQDNKQDWLIDNRSVRA